MTRLAWALLLAVGAASWLLELGRLGQSVAPALADLDPVFADFALDGTIEFPSEALGELPPEAWTFRHGRGG